MVPEGSVGGAPWPGVFEFTLTYNKGIAFGLMQGMGVYMSPIAILIAVITAIYSYRNPRESLLTHLAVGMIGSGAIGNLIDRVWLGKVTDMFWFRLINFPVFNVADALISVGAVFMVLGTFLSKSAEEPKPSADEPGGSLGPESVGNSDR